MAGPAGGCQVGVVVAGGVRSGPEEWVVRGVLGRGCTSGHGVVWRLG